MFDFIDIDIEGTGPGDDPRRRYRGRASPQGGDRTHSNVKGDPPEVKGARQFLAAIGHIDFDPAWFAYELRKGSIKVQRVFLSVILAWLGEWQEIHNRGLTKGNRDAVVIGTTAHQMMEALDGQE